MRASSLLKFSATLLIVLNSSLAAMADVNIGDNNQVQTIDCQGQSANINGNKNVLTLKNCNQLNVMGNMNVITVLPVKQINVLGNQNKITWQRAAGLNAAIQIVNTMGNGNATTEIHGKAAGQATVTPSAQVYTVQSGGSTVVTRGYNGASQVNISPNSIKVRGTGYHGAGDVNIGPNGINIKNPDGTSINIGN
jgi:hypothetical protein